MSDPSDDNFNSWGQFLLGALLTIVGLTKLLRYVDTGEIVHRPSSRIPLNLFGADALALYGFFALAGVFLLVAGIKGLLRK